MQEVNKKYLKRVAVVTTFFSAVTIGIYVALNQNKSSVKSSAASNASTNKSPYAKVDMCGSLMAATMMSGESKSGKTSKSKASKSKASKSGGSDDQGPSFGLVGEGVGFCRDAANNLYDRITTNRTDAVADDQGCFDYCEGLPLGTTNANALGFELNVGTDGGDVDFCSCLYETLPDDLVRVDFDEQFDVIEVNEGNGGTGPIVGVDGTAGVECFSIERFELVGVGICEDDNDNIYDRIVTLRPAAVADDQGCFDYCEGLPLDANALGFEFGTIEDVDFCSCLYDNDVLPFDFDTTAAQMQFPEFDVSFAFGESSGTGPIEGSTGIEGSQCFRVTIGNDEDADSSQFALHKREDYNYYLASQIDDQVSSPRLNEFNSKLVKPVIVDDVATADSKTLIGVLRNDAPAPGQGELTVVSASAVVQSDSYECEPSDNGRRVKFTPGDDFTGKAQCTYTACDEFDQCGDATIFVTVRSKSSEGVRRAKSSKSSSSESSSSDSSSSESSSDSSSKSCVNLDDICTSSTRQDSKSNKSGGSKTNNSASAPTTCNMPSSKENTYTSSKSKSSKRKA